MLGKVLERSFYFRDTLQVAQELLGMYIVHVRDGVMLAAEITETEAYTGIEDRACHSFGGKCTPRTKVMYGPGGHAYVYLIYGIYNMFNIVTEEEGNPCAVLVRQARPVIGNNIIANLRFGRDFDKMSRARQRALLDGPGKICQGLSIQMEHNGYDLTTGPLLIYNPPRKTQFTLGVGTRINIDYAKEATEFPYRFFQVIPKA